MRSVVFLLIIDIITVANSYRFEHGSKQFSRRSARLPYYQSSGLETDEDAILIGSNQGLKPNIPTPPNHYPNAYFPVHQHGFHGFSGYPRPRVYAPPGYYGYPGNAGHGYSDPRVIYGAYPTHPNGPYGFSHSAYPGIVDGPSSYPEMNGLYPGNGYNSGTYPRPETPDYYP